MNKAIKAAQAARQAKKDRGEDFTRLNPLQKWEASNKTSRKLAINAMCYQCQGGGHDPGTIDGIRNCTCEKTCPLWAVRPYQEKRKCL